MIPYRLINGVAFFVRTNPQTGILFFTVEYSVYLLWENDSSSYHLFQLCTKLCPLAAG